MKTKLNSLNSKLIVGVAGLNLTISALAADALPSDPSAGNSEIDQLKKQIEALDQKVRVLESDRQSDQQNTAAALESQPKMDRARESHRTRPATFLPSPAASSR